ncbi:MAG TPA: NAD(P)-dependent oxidoreductase [Candidatus Limnocylindrales bacterium]
MGDSDGRSPAAGSPSGARAATRRVVAVTGAAGTIGRVVLARLGDRYALRALTHHSADFPSRTVELTDVDSLIESFRGADVVLHLAGASTVDSSWDSVLEANIIGARNAFEATAIAGVPKIVFASSNHVVGAYEVEAAPAIYRRAERGTIDENVETRPDSPYGVSKAFGEALGRYYAEFRGLSVVCVRIGTVRPDDDPRPANIASTAGWLELTRDEKYERMRATWLSHRDCAELLAAAIDSDVRWAVVYGVSDNPRRFWSLEGARQLLGFHPADSAPDD